jgi:hypothetical protein
MDIRPQENNADLVFKLIAANPLQLQSEMAVNEVQLKMQVTIRNGIYQERLLRILIGLCGMQIERLENESINELEFVVEGDVNAEDLALAANNLDIHLLELLDLNPVWADGNYGVMQLIVLLHLDQVLQRAHQ